MDTIANLNNIFHRLKIFRNYESCHFGHLTCMYHYHYNYGNKLSRFPKYCSNFFKEMKFSNLKIMNLENNEVKFHTGDQFELNHFPFLNVLNLNSNKIIISYLSTDFFSSTPNLKEF